MFTILKKKCYFSHFFYVNNIQLRHFQWSKLSISSYKRDTKLTSLCYITKLVTMPFNNLIKQFLRLVWHLNELTFLSVFTGKLPTNIVLQSLLVSRLLFIPFGFSSSSSRSGFFVFFFFLFWIQSYFSLWEHEVKICKIKW